MGTLDSVGQIRRYVEGELSRTVGTESEWDAEARLATDVRCGDPFPRGPGSLSWTIHARAPDLGGFTLEASPESREFLIWYGSSHEGEAGPRWIMRPAVHVAFDDVRFGVRPDGPDFSLGGVLACVLAEAKRYPPNDGTYV